MDLNRRPSDLVSLVSQGVVEFQGAPGSHRITFESQASELTGRWDIEGLERVTVNLLSNAVKYSREDTPIAVTVKEAQRDGSARAALSVVDGGVGIPREDLAHIFDRLTTNPTCARMSSTVNRPFQWCQTASLSKPAK